MRRDDLLSEVLEHLRWETRLGGTALPVAAPSAEARPARPSPSSREVASQDDMPSHPSPMAQEAREPMRSGAAAPASASPGDRRVRLAQLEEAVRACTRCDLHRQRTQTVFARGTPDSPLMFVGEGPGADEDRLGEPFVGRAGQLLDKMVAAMGYGRDDVYICNVVKCRPPGNRTPLPNEAGACEPFLTGQIDVVAPRVIVALGRCAAENMGLVPGAGGWRGRWGKYKGIDVMPTYHPAFLLRSPEFKRPVWEDLQKVMARLQR